MEFISKSVVVVSVQSISKSTVFARNWLSGGMGVHLDVHNWVA